MFCVGIMTLRVEWSVSRRWRSGTEGVGDGVCIVVIFLGLNAKHRDIGYV